MTSSLDSTVDHTGGSAAHFMHADGNMPDTVAKAVAFLASKGYVDDFRLTAEGLVDADTDATHSLEPKRSSGRGDRPRRELHSLESKKDCRLCVRSKRRPRACRASSRLGGRRQRS